MARPAIRLPMWLIPMLYVCVTIAAVLILPRLEHAWLPGYSHDMSAASAQAMLGAIASGMMALVGMVLFGLDDGLDTLDGARKQADDAPIALIGRSSSGRWAPGGLGVVPLSPALAPERGLAVPVIGATF